MDDSPVKVSFEPGIMNIDPWEVNIPYSKCFKPPQRRHICIKLCWRTSFKNRKGV